MTPMRSYLDAGIPVSLGSDSPVVPYPPLWVLYHFITRDTISAGVMGDHQRLSREEALRAMSRGYAYLTFEEGLKGSIEPGKADEREERRGELSCLYVKLGLVRPRSKWYTSGSNRCAVKVYLCNSAPRLRWERGEGKVNKVEA